MREKAMENYKEKCSRLKAAMDRLGQTDCVVAFSGGADSSLLLKMACEAGKKYGTTVYAATVSTRLHPAGDLEIAARVARECGAVHKVLQVDELAEAGIEDNPRDRCYRCKKILFLKIKELARSLGADQILEGTNEDDLHQYRPGLQALKELGIVSPLAQAGLTKEEVRSLAEEYHISVASRPASPCLATRFPYGTRLSYEAMDRISAAEDYIRGLGFYNVRVRLHGQVARIEVDEKDLVKLASLGREVREFMKARGFVYVTMDLEGFRSGSMDL